MSSVLYIPGSSLGQSSSAGCNTSTTNQAWDWVFISGGDGGGVASSVVVGVALSLVVGVASSLMG